MSTYGYWDMKRKFKDEFTPIKVIIYIWNCADASLDVCVLNSSSYRILIIISFQLYKISVEVIHDLNNFLRIRELLMQSGHTILTFGIKLP